MGADLLADARGAQGRWCLAALAGQCPNGPLALSILPGEVPSGESLAALVVSLSLSMRCFMEGSIGFCLSVVAFWLKLCYRGGDATEGRRIDGTTDLIRAALDWRYVVQQFVLGRTYLHLVGASTKRNEGRRA